MRKSDFIRLIGSNNFGELFISHLGWSKWRGNSRLLPIIIEEIDYQFRTIAERSGLQVVVAEVDALPKNSLARKIDNQLRKQAQDYISIYVLRDDPKHHLWVVPLKNVDKRDLVSLEYADVDHADFLFSKIDDIEFSPGETTTIVDVKEAVHHAFFVNSEKITKDFYTGFKKQHSSFVKYITGIDDEIAIKDNRNKQWYASVMLNRLMFCYFIQKKGFLNGNPNYLRDKLKECITKRGKNQFFSTFYLRFLRRLFSDGLNRPKHDHEFEKQFGNIPYLNGGMFDKHKIERDYADIDIEDDAFVSLFEFFDKWQWHLDTRVTASGKDINPDVLGYIFEQYINDRAQMGAYYTKEDITEYIGRNTILPFLFDRVANSSKAMGAMFTPGGWVWSTLQQSGSRYLFDAVKQGWTADWRNKIPQEIAIGLDTEAPELLSRRARWNDRTPEPFALPTEIWRETIERLQRVDAIMAKISKGEISSINDFITYNLDIRLFASDLISKSESGAFVFNFYEALRSVTVLDPTCGSGAFLFAALNILEPLYYECIMRLDEFKSQPKVKMALDEISLKYRSNIHYFIYKSIILRNLYGVDIMVEATEIAKLRLFLKMVAVVDVDYHSYNMGLDPLPDIDFNIRCGNTLVGYANEEEIEKDLNSASDILQVLANQEFKDRIEKEMQIVSATYREFKRLQLVQEDHFAEFKQAKNELQNRLNILNDTLSRRLFIATKGDPGAKRFQPLFDAWLTSHQPFHWIAEFYQIIHDNGGFDVIIGNPPYVTFTDTNLPYSVRNYVTYPTKNLFSLVGERCTKIGSQNGSIGYIIPLSGLSIPGFEPLQNLIFNNRISWNSFYSGDRNPSELFEGVKIRAGIYISRVHYKTEKLVSKYIKYYANEREILFNKIVYTHANTDEYINAPKIHLKLGSKIISKINNFEKKLESELYGRESIYYHAAPIYWNKALYDLRTLVRQHLNIADSYKRKNVSVKFKDFTFLLINSSLFFYYWIVMSDCYNLTQRYISEIGIPQNFDASLFKSLADKLNKRLNETIQIVEYTYKNKGTVRFAQFFPKKSKSLIDEIDKVLAKYYGFTEEELDFIINYDIKYRMGEELNNDNDE